MTKYTDHKETLKLIDRDGNILKEKEQAGWEKYNSIKNNFENKINQLWMPSDGEGDYNFISETIPHNALLHEVTTTVEFNEAVVGYIVYTRECELV